MPSHLENRCLSPYSNTTTQHVVLVMKQCLLNCSLHSKSAFIKSMQWGSLKVKYLSSVKRPWVETQSTLGSTYSMENSSAGTAYTLYYREKQMYYKLHAAAWKPLWKHFPHQQEWRSGSLQEDVGLVRKLQHWYVITAVHRNASAQKAVSVKTHNSLRKQILQLFNSKDINQVNIDVFVMLKRQIQDSPVCTAVNVSPGLDLSAWLATDEYVDILHSVHLAGILKDKYIWARTGHT